jgi:hypothetical protein
MCQGWKSKQNRRIEIFYVSCFGYIVVFLSNNELKVQDLFLEGVQMKAATYVKNIYLISKSFIKVQSLNPNTVHVACPSVILSCAKT